MVRNSFFKKERAQTQIKKFAHNQNEKKDTEWKLDESTLIFKGKRFLDECIWMNVLYTKTLIMQ